jgi:hypothetical protein
VQQVELAAAAALEYIQAVQTELLQTGKQVLSIPVAAVVVEFTVSQTWPVAVAQVL